MLGKALAALAHHWQRTPVTHTVTHQVLAVHPVVVIVHEHVEVPSPDFLNEVPHATCLEPLVHGLPGTNGELFRACKQCQRASRSATVT